ncbi:hypothetical protein SADUNF_Sadunf16G0307800 [Salix dunnii]|uniref:J domain-containing protein n=1 Tax=Salix dunnii TaxID=1413687 RepID=A0A835JD60_9ROSI|nr:hypothetical protein SADUNF_Sadunf16G0307800 [Salix dunnii]
MEIKNAYRSLAKEYHPDAMLDRDDEHWEGVDFIEIHNAYETLSDPEARAAYDMSLSAAARNFYRRAAGYSVAMVGAASCKVINRRHRREDVHCRQHVMPQKVARAARAG